MVNSEIMSSGAPSVRFSDDKLFIRGVGDCDYICVRNADEEIILKWVGIRLGDKTETLKFIINRFCFLTSLRRAPKHSSNRLARRKKRLGRAANEIKKERREIIRIIKHVNACDRSVLRAGAAIVFIRRPGASVHIVARRATDSRTERENRCGGATTISKSMNANILIFSCCICGTQFASLFGGREARTWIGSRTRARGSEMGQANTRVFDLVAGRRRYTRNTC